MADEQEPAPNPLLPPQPLRVPAVAGRRQGKSNYSGAEIEHMLDILEEILPIGTDEWQAVEDQHNIDGVYNRTALNLRKKLYALKNKKMPTGDPNCPPAVRRAKHIFRDIGDRCDASDASEDYDLEDNNFGRRDDGNGVHGDDAAPANPAAGGGGGAAAGAQAAGAAAAIAPAVRGTPGRGGDGYTGNPLVNRSRTPTRPGTPTRHDQFMEMMQQQMAQEQVREEARRKEAEEERRFLREQSRLRQEEDSRSRIAMNESIATALGAFAAFAAARTNREE